MKTAVPPGHYLDPCSGEVLPIAEALRRATDEIDVLNRLLAKAEARLRELQAQFRPRAP